MFCGVGASASTMRSTNVFPVKVVSLLQRDMLGTGVASARRREECACSVGGMTLRHGMRDPAADLPAMLRRMPGTTDTLPLPLYATSITPVGSNTGKTVMPLAVEYTVHEERRGVVLEKLTIGNNFRILEHLGYVANVGSGGSPAS